MGTDLTGDLVYTQTHRSAPRDGVAKYQEGVTLMKKMLLTGTALLVVISGSAMAADLSRPPPAPAPVYTKAPMMPAFTWTGCYIGGNAGGVWVSKTFTIPATGVQDASLSPSSWLAGGQIGCNYQVSAWVFGVQGDYDWSNATASVLDSVFPTVTDSVQVKGLASVTGRVGYAFDRSLLYVKGGGAWESDSYTATSALGVSTLSDTRAGWTIGAGFEYAFLDWLTGFVEYDYYNFGTKGETLVGTVAPLGAAVTVNVNETKSVAKAGLNFKFGGWH
jgi:outer membrane immunogenic protein